MGGCPTGVVKALLEKAPGLKLKDNFGGKYALFFARFKGCSEILSLVSRHDSPKAAAGR